MLHNYVKELLTKNVNINTNLNEAEGPSRFLSDTSYKDFKNFLLKLKNQD